MEYEVEKMGGKHKNIKNQMAGILTFNHLAIGIVLLLIGVQGVFARENVVKISERCIEPRLIVG